MALSVHLFLLVLLFLALFQEGGCAELLFLFLGLALWSLRLPRLLGRDGDLHRFLVAQAQLRYLHAQILLQFCQVILSVGNAVCQRMQRRGEERSEEQQRSDYATSNETPSKRPPTPSNRLSPLTGVIMGDSDREMVEPSNVVISSASVASSSSETCDQELVVHQSQSITQTPRLAAVNSSVLTPQRS